MGGWVSETYEFQCLMGAVEDKDMWGLCCSLAWELLTAPQVWLAAWLAFGSMYKGTQLLTSLWVSSNCVHAMPRQAEQGCLYGFMQAH